MKRDSAEGFHNLNFDFSKHRLFNSKTYKDLSTVVIVPERNGLVPMRVVMSWRNLIPPMNQKIIWIPVIGEEIGVAYNKAVELILEHQDLKKFKYMLTVESDNVPPPDGLLKLYEHIDKYDVVSGLYWTKGEAGQPMIYGNPKEMPKNFIPQIPLPDTIQEANGLGMGFTLFRLNIFHKVPKPWFVTEQKFTPGVGTRMYTQDLYFFEEAAKYGFKFACDTRVKVGHYDVETDTMW